MGYGVRPRLHVAVIYYIFGRLKPREAAAAMRHLEFRSAEIDAVAKLVPETQKVVARAERPQDERSAGRL